MYVCMYICMYICMYACMYVYVNNMCMPVSEFVSRADGEEIRDKLWRRFLCVTITPFGTEVEPDVYCRNATLSSVLSVCGYMNVCMYVLYVFTIYVCTVCIYCMYYICMYCMYVCMYCIYFMYLCMYCMYVCITYI